MFCAPRTVCQCLREKVLVVDLPAEALGKPGTYGRSIVADLRL
jgi:hypothetical protein